MGSCQWLLPRPLGSWGRMRLLGCCLPGSAEGGMLRPHCQICAGRPTGRRDGVYHLARRQGGLHLGLGLTLAPGLGGADRLGHSTC